MFFSAESLKINGIVVFPSDIISSFTYSCTGANFVCQNKIFLKILITSTGNCTSMKYRYCIGTDFGNFCELPVQVIFFARSQINL